MPSSYLLDQWLKQNLELLNLRFDIFLFLLVPDLLLGGGGIERKG